MFRSWDWEGALEALDAAVEINPSYEFARRGRAYALAYLGRHEEARRDIDHALAVDPLNAQVAHMAGLVYDWSGDPERAATLYQEAADLDSGNPNGRHGLGLLRCQMGDVESGVDLLHQALRISHEDPLIVGDLGWCLASAGRAEDARALLADLETRSAAEWVSPIALARIHIGLGDEEAALAELERAYDERAYFIVGLDVERRWDPIRSKERFQNLRRAVGLGAHARASEL
jgi:Flp pilus assembly protein TadD